MRKFYSIPLLFFALAAALGLFLRWQFIEPTPGVRYTWFLHSHSHVMFLGWIFNILYLAFVDHHIPPTNHSIFRKLFVLLQILVVAMMISFPLQGYGTWSIIFSTLHTLGAMAFIVLFFHRTKSKKTIPLWFARTALIFFLISTAGPFSLGYLMANGLGQTVWYNFSIYYYLHFQYNGFFLFGVLSLFFQLVETRQIQFDVSKPRSFGKWLAVACVPAYALSILFSKPSVFFYVVGAAAGLLQMFTLYVLFSLLVPMARQLKKSLYPFSFTISKIILIALAVKFILQLASAHPYIAQLAYELRPVVIAYLHLVLIGVISLSLIVWYMEKKLVRLKATRLSVNIMLIGFAGSEICLVLVPWWSKITQNTSSSSTVIFAFSIMMFVAASLFCVAYKWKIPTQVAAPDKRFIERES